MSNIIESCTSENVGVEPHSGIPAYLEKNYWWAYVRPNALAFWDRDWLVNLILFGNFARLRDAALNQLGTKIDGDTLQIACVYGDFSMRLAQRITEGGSLDIVDVLPIQLDNLQKKLHPQSRVRIMQSDSSKLNLPNESYDQAVIFFLLHEQPASVRVKTLSEVLRVIKPGGKLVIVDFHKPTFRNPFRYLYPLIFKLLEPFALDMWEQSIEEWLPKDFVPTEIIKETMFGGLYQQIVIRK